MSENNPKIVIIHCSDTPDYPESHEYFDRFGASDIDLWHRRNGWNSIGYHSVIRRTGKVEEGRLENIQGAHVRGRNKDSIGLCLIGERLFTDYQIVSLLTQYDYYKSVFGIDWTMWFGHYEFDNKKTCPGMSMTAIRHLLKYYERK